MIFFKILGSNIKEKRKEKGFNIQQLADDLGIAYSTMANIESGTKKPTIEQLEKLGEALDYYPVELMHIDYDENVYKSLSLEEQENVLNDMKEYLDLIREIQKKRDVEFSGYLEKAIQLKSKCYSPTGKEFTQQDFTEIQYMVSEMIKIRLSQISNSK